MVKDYPGLTGTAPDAMDADPNGALTHASLSDLQKPNLAADEVHTGASR